MIFEVPGEVWEEEGSAKKCRAEQFGGSMNG
jgi:hypothetical protein